MNTVQDGVPFSFNYVAPDQAQGLIVGARIYDITTGTPLLLSTQAMDSLGRGAYSGTYTGSPTSRYMVVMAVFTNVDLATGHVDTSYPTASALYQCGVAQTTVFAFDYTAYDQATGLSIQAAILDANSSPPTLLGTVNLVHVAMGAYLGRYTGQLGHAYQARCAVYTDNTYATLDDTRALACASLQGGTLASGGASQSTPPEDIAMCVGVIQSEGILVGTAENETALIGACGGDDSVVGQIVA